MAYIISMHGLAESKQSEVEDSEVGQIDSDSVVDWLTDRLSGGLGHHLDNTGRKDGNKRLLWCQNSPTPNSHKWTTSIGAIVAMPTTWKKEVAAVKPS